MTQTRQQPEAPTDTLRTGDLTSLETFALLEDDPSAIVIDVRGLAEQARIGVPDLSALPVHHTTVVWDGDEAAFVAELRTAAPTDTGPIYMLCRSGQRSRAAADAAASAGYSRVFNVADGFEGAPDHNGYRGKISGWQAAGLPSKRGR